ncbi:hypothetical protein MNB_SV-14-903 [hydrothermal vent metagenome]|uniref:YfdX protein n=1 Tax=hydrothermal vent metagenome TaxID=652676 RepID=A0A1W1BJ54_9ZZZZ
MEHIKAVAVNKATSEAKKQNADIKLVKEAVDSLKYVEDALNELDKNNKDKASEYLAKALGKLEVTLSSKKVPELLPVDSMFVANEFIGTSKTIKEAVKLAKEFLSDYRVQEARKVLAPLKSEITISTINIPLATFPDALKEASKLIHDNKTEEAKVVLAAALSTLVEVKKVIPVPLVEAMELIVTASNVAQKDTDEAKKLLNLAQEELKIAKYLGYVSSSDVTYKTLDNAIDELKSDIKSKEVKMLFKNLKDKLKDFTSKIFS